MKSIKYDGLQIRIPHFQKGKGTYTLHFEEDDINGHPLYSMTWSEDSDFREFNHREDRTTELIIEDIWIPINNPINLAYEIY